jgi:hypothetical protein
VHYFRKQVLAMICGGAVTRLIKNDTFIFPSPTAVKDDFKRYINETNQLVWFTSKIANYGGLNSTPLEFADIITKFGVSYTYNMMEATRLLRTERHVLMVIN